MEQSLVSGAISNFAAANNCSSAFGLCRNHPHGALFSPQPFFKQLVQLFQS